MVVNVTDTTVTLSWIPPDSPNGIITHYQVQYKRSDSSGNFMSLELLDPILTYTVTGLGMEESVDIEVELVSNCACPGVRSASVSCASKPCDPTTFTFGTVDSEYCLDGTVQAFSLSASPDDLPGNGTGTWSGVPISDPSGIVDPALVSAGSYDVTYTYEEG